MVYNGARLEYEQKAARFAERGDLGDLVTASSKMGIMCGLALAQLVTMGDDALLTEFEHIDRRGILAAGGVKAFANCTGSVWSIVSELAFITARKFRCIGCNRCFRCFGCIRCIPFLLLNIHQTTRAYHVKLTTV